MTSTRFTYTADRVFACQEVPKPLSRMRPVSEVAFVTNRPPRTIRNWARDGHIPSTHRNGHLLVDLVAAAHRSEQTGRRNRARAA
jgi:hypothetical protein